MSYVDLTTLKGVLEIEDTDRDTFLQMCLDAATGVVDKVCGRTFTLDSSATARQVLTSGKTWTDSDGAHLIVPDIGSLTGLAVETGDGTTWGTLGASNYQLEPLGALDVGTPATGLLAGSWTTSQVRVTARWGWPSVPAPVIQATLTQAIRLFKRPNSPEGVLGSAEWGAIRVPRADPDVEYLLSGYALPGFA